MAYECYLLSQAGPCSAFNIYGLPAAWWPWFVLGGEADADTCKLLGLSAGAS